MRGIHIPPGGWGEVGGSSKPWKLSHMIAPERKFRQARLSTSNNKEIEEQQIPFLDRIKNEMIPPLSNTVFNLGTMPWYLVLGAVVLSYHGKIRGPSN